MAVTKVFLKYKTDDFRLNEVLETYKDKINLMIDEIPWTTSNVDFVRLKDTNDSHYLEVFWDEDDIANRALTFHVNAANRAISLAGNLNVESLTSVNQDLTNDAQPTFDDLTLTTGFRSLMGYRYSFMMMGD